MSECVFCAIVAGQSPCSKVYEDEHVIVFMDIYPAVRGHVLVVSKRHADDILSVDEATVGAAASVTRRLARAMQHVLSPDGISVVQANGEAAGQTVMHYHVHLLPRVNGVKLRLHGPRQASHDELDAVASELAAALEDT